MGAAQAAQCKHLGASSAWDMACASACTPHSCGLDGAVSVLQLSEQEWLKQQLEPPTLVDSVRAHRQDVNKYTMAP